MNPFRVLFDAFGYLAQQARRLGDALGSMADQVEQRAALPHDPTVVNGKEPAKRVTKVESR